MRILIDPAYNTITIEFENDFWPVIEWMGQASVEENLHLIFDGRKRQFDHEGDLALVQKIKKLDPMEREEVIKWIEEHG